MGYVSEVRFQQFSVSKTRRIELSEGTVELARHKDGIKEAFKYDGYTIPLPDRSIDLGFATHVLEHVPDPRGFLREHRRVGKKQFLEIPIDYSKNIHTEYLLSYGHINTIRH